jgi:ParB-like chromosome segregation protein Spo0J/DNA modification methylase
MTPNPQPPQTLKLTDLNIPPRARSSYDRIEDLAASIRDRGLIQPVVVNRQSDDTFTLVAGGRRCKAIELLGIKELFHGVSSVPGQAGFVYLDDLSPTDLLEIELEENLFRHDLDWRDRVSLTSRIHRAKISENALEGRKWGYRQTGELLGTSLGDVQACLTIADLLTTKPELFLNCSSVVDASRVVLTLKSDEAIKLQLFRNHSAARPPTTTHTDISSFFEDGDSDTDLETTPTPSPSADQSLNITSERVRVVMAKQFKLGDSLKILDSIPANSFDHVVTDPPYGIDLENMDLRGQERVEETHEVEPNIQLLEAFIKKAYKVLRDNGFFVMWYDLDHHEKIQEWGKEVGFAVQRWPFVWHKEHPCKNQAPAYNFTKNFEVAVIMRKGNATLISPQTSSVICAEGSVEKKMYDNPFAKPFAVWKTLISAIAHKGQSIVDPFMGGGSCCRAAINLGMVPYGFEIDERHYNQAISGVRETYQLLLGDRVEFK